MTPADYCPKCNSANVIFSKKRSAYVCEDCGHVLTEAQVSPLRIFLSYGHDANEELVRRIKADLEQRGHDVWFDKSEIKFGDDWRHSITEGILESNRVLSFLSKHSTRDPGVCLDEIAIAIGVKGGNIQTILVENETEAKPPSSISYIQWLDMHEWKERYSSGGVTWTEWYQPKFAEIVRVVECDESRRFAGEIATLSGYLAPISSESRIATLLTKGFWGRTWLIEAVEHWRSATDRSSRLFWISGSPGVGKSAFIAHLTHFGRDKVIAAQFVEWDKPDHRNAQRVVRSIAFQIATRLPDYRKLLLTLPEIARLETKDASELFDYLLTNPLRTVIPSDRERYLVVIDALDEASEAGLNPLVTLLARNASSLPDWIGLVVTSRPESAVTGPLQGLKPFILDTCTESNRIDIRAYLRQKLAVHLQTQTDPDRIIELILTKSEGVFLYVERFCEDLQQGHLSMEHPEQFPHGLGGIFYLYFQRLFPDLEGFRKEVRPALRVIIAAREPLPLDILQRLFNWQTDELNDFTRPLNSLFPTTIRNGTKVIKPYHKSLADWLVEKNLSEPFWCDINPGQLALAEVCWKDYTLGEHTMSPYAFRHLASHLVEAGRWDDLVTAIDDVKLGLLVRWTEQGEHAEGYRILQGIIAHADKQSNKKERLPCMMTQLARIFVLNGDFEEAKRWLKQSLQNVSFWRGRRSEAITLHELGAIYLYEDDLPNSNLCYRKALRNCTWGYPTFPDEAAANLLGLSTLARRLNQYSKAKLLAQKALRKAKASGDVYHQIAAHRALFIAWKDDLRYTEAEKHLAQAELAASLIHSRRETLANQEARGWLNLERAWLQETSVQIAENCFQNAMDESELFGLSTCVAGVQIGLAWCALIRGDATLARNLCAKAQYTLKIRNNRMFSTILSILQAGIELQTGELGTAERIYREIIDLCQARNIPSEGSVAWTGLGATLWRSNQFIQAEFAWDRAREQAKCCPKSRRCLTETGIKRLQQNPASVLL